MNQISNKYYFENEFGSINFSKVIIATEKLEFNFKNIAYIEIKEQKLFFNKRCFLRVIFTNATLKDIHIDKKHLQYARDFEIQFLYARFLNSEIE